MLDEILSEIDNIDDCTRYGKVSAVKGLLVEVVGITDISSIGSTCEIITRDGDKIKAEVVGISGNISLLIPFYDTIGIGVGCEVSVKAPDQSIYPSDAWLGRVINAFGEPIDGKGPLKKGNKAYSLKTSPPPSNSRHRIKKKVDMGVRAINSFLTCCYGQRMGIFAGSGVGKSMLMAMFTKFAACDIKVIGLIGERGREVQEFIEDYLGEEGMAKAVVIVATSDEAALIRKRATYLTMTVSEFYRDQGLEVMCMIDSITRFAMAQREIGLSAGEPPTTKGYTPSVFAELPKLLERAGPGMGEQGNITGLFSVLVEGDDTNEPISDAIRAIIDGHIVLDRSIADKGRYPAINILKSISRMIPNCNTDAENALITRAKNMLSTFADMEDMIKIGAYNEGSNNEVDDAIHYTKMIEQYLTQSEKEPDSLENSYSKLTDILNTNRARK